MDLQQILNNIDFFFDNVSNEKLDELKRTYLTVSADDISVEDFFHAYNMEYAAFEGEQPISETISIKLNIYQITKDILSGENASFEISSSPHSVCVENISEYQVLYPENEWATAS